MGEMLFKIFIISRLIYGCWDMGGRIVVGEIHVKFEVCGTRIYSKYI